MDYMTPLGRDLLVALVVQRWTLLQGVAPGAFLAISPSLQVFDLDDAILRDADLQPLLQSQVAEMREKGGLTWPWPPRN